MNSLFNYDENNELKKAYKKYELDVTIAIMLKGKFIWHYFKINSYKMIMYFLNSELLLIVRLNKYEFLLLIIFSC